MWSVDRTDGRRRIAGAIGGCLGSAAGNVKTDDKAGLDWNGTSGNSARTTTLTCLLVRDVEHNLAVAQDIDEDTGPLELKLEPGLTLAGRAECDGKPVTNATATLIFWTGQAACGFRIWPRNQYAGPI